MTESEQLKWKIQKVHSEKTALIADFDCGQLVSKAGLPLELYCNKNKKQVFAKASNGKMVLSSRAPIGRTTTYLAVEDVETGDVELVPALKLPMKRCIEQTSSKKLDKTYAERYEDFTKNFGTKKLQNIIKSRERLQVSQVNAKLVASETLNETVVSERVEDTSFVDETVEFPRRNTEFSSVKNVYSLNEVFCCIEYECFDNYASTNWAFEVVNKDKLVEWAANDTYSKYVLQRLGQVSKDETLRKMQLRCLAAYDIFTYIYKLKVKELRARDPMPRVEDPYKTQIMDVFSRVIMDGKGRGLRTISMKAKDKIIAHCLLVQLYLEDFRVDMTLLQNDIKAPTTRITNVAWMLGCHVIQGRSPSGISTRTIVLKLPLYEHKGDGRHRSSKGK